MNVLAYCDAEYLKQTARVVGEHGIILTCPPHSHGTMQPSAFEGRDVIYLDLHGEPGRATLYGGGGYIPALHVDTVRAARFAGATVVFATTCYFPETPFLEAFLAAGAVVVAGSGANYRYSPELGRLFLNELRRGRWVDAALKEAQKKLSRQLWRWVASAPAMRDALEFRVWRKAE